MYYVLECFTPLDADPADIAEVPVVSGVESWMAGRAITTPVPEPLVLALDPNEPGPLKEMYNLEALVLSDRLLASLRAAGVDNLQAFRATIDDPFTGVVHTNYHVVNVVGCVAAADLEKSQWSTESGTPLVDTNFDSLTIDPAKATGFLMFRLAECISAIVIHDSVRRHLLADGFTSLTFMHPKDYVG